MPVNDATNAQDAMSNCALCTVAGLTGTTAGTIQRELAQFLELKALSADMAFFWYAVNCGLAPKDLSGTAPTKAQVLGVEAWLRKQGWVTGEVGSVDNPLQRDVLLQSMKGMPDGTRFACLVMGEPIPGFGNTRQSHWIAATMEGGKIGFKDYQLDITDKLCQLRVRMFQKHRDVNGMKAPFPSIDSEMPRGPFGGRYEDGYRMMAVVCIPIGY